MTDTPKKTVNRRLQLVDPDTGEVENRDATWEEPGKRGRRGKRMTFSMMNTAPDGIAQLVLTGTEWRVLIHFIAATSPETHEASIRVTDIATALDISRSAVGQHIRKLRDRRILFRITAYRWRVNTHIAYRGSAEDWGQQYYSDPEPIWEVTP